MTRDEILEGLKQAVLTYDVEGGKRLTRQALEAGLGPLEAIDDGLSKGIKIIGDKLR